MIYVSSACIKKEKISDVLQTYVRAGIKDIELSGGTVYYPELEQDLLTFKKNYRVNYACHSYFPPPKQEFVVNLASCDEEIYKRSIQHYKNCIELLVRLGCKTLSIHAGFYVAVSPEQIGKELNAAVCFDHNKSLDRFCESYKMLEHLCEKNGIVLYLENNVLNPSNYERFAGRNLLMLTDFETYEELKAKMDFNLLLDLGHLHVSAKSLCKDYLEECKKFAPHVKWIHLSDNNGSFDEHKPFSEKSEILTSYQQFWDDSLPVTLETNGNVDDILHSMRLVRGEGDTKCQRSN